MFPSQSFQSRFSGFKGLSSCKTTAISCIENSLESGKSLAKKSSNSFHFSPVIARLCVVCKNRGLVRFYVTLSHSYLLTACGLTAWLPS